jgi:hypothetical protein
LVAHTMIISLATGIKAIIILCNFLCQGRRQVYKLTIHGHFNDEASGEIYTEWNTYTLNKMK